MRIGIISFSSFILLFCFVVLNTTDIQPEKVDTILEGVDYNVFSGPDVNFSSDANTILASAPKSSSECLTDAGSRPISSQYLSSKLLRF